MSTSNGRGEGAAPFPGSAEPVEHRPGAWPKALQTSVCKAPPAADVVFVDFEAERAEKIVIMGRLAAYMEAEPTPQAVRAFGRRWANRIGQLADDIAKAKVSDR